jgi:hypothetical protein
MRQRDCPFVSCGIRSPPATKAKTESATIIAKVPCRPQCRYGCRGTTGKGYAMDSAMIDQLTVCLPNEPGRLAKVR